mmetsp:Transcript_117473/g.365877  ORF Transcript_117473/g.365877 Transcript_117473/m.365877 type:complete len:250 (-) Transcript_117473:1308-2057(-)
MDFCKFSEERRPCSMPTTMEANWSSRRMMSAASFATSVPRMPIATPTFACFSAGASLTPSPVIATMSPIALPSGILWPHFWRACTISCLWMGVTRAKTRACTTTSFQKAARRKDSSSCPSENSSVVGTLSASSSPVTTVYLGSSLALVMMEISLAMATPVSGWSPVIMTTLMPAAWQSSTASLTPFLGGSWMPNRPMKIMSERNSVLACSTETLSQLKSAGYCARFSAMASTRRAVPMRLFWAAVICAR